MDTRDQEVEVEILISAIEERPVLWDKSLEEYKSRTETTSAWMEVCLRLNPDFETLSDSDKNKYGTEIRKKWINIRDRWNKYLKKLTGQKITGSKAKTVKKYVYNDQLSFLRKNATRNASASSFEGDKEEEEKSEEKNEEEAGVSETTADDFRHRSSPPPVKKSKKNQKYTELEKLIVEKLEQPEDRHMSFFKGILPSLQLLKDDQVIQFQAAVLKILQDIHRPQLSTLVPTTGHQSSLWNLPPPRTYTPSVPPSTASHTYYGENWVSQAAYSILQPQPPRSDKQTPIHSSVQSPESDVTSEQSDFSDLNVADLNN